MSVYSRILSICIICLVAVLSSCTIVDTGSAVNNIGRYIPVDEKRIHVPKTHPDKAPRYTVYTLGELSYIKLGVCYLSAKNKWFHCCQIAGCPYELYKRFYNSPSILPSLEYYYAEISTKNLRNNNLMHTKRLIPEKDFNPKNARRSTITIEHTAQRIISINLPERLSSTNTAVQPIRWIAEVADVPLSIIATPINWFLIPFDADLWSL